MPLLHMETDLVRGVGGQLQQAAGLLTQQAQQLNYSVQTLLSAWQGNSTDIFVGEISLLLQRLNEFAHAGETLNQRLQHEVDEWEQVASVLGVGGAASIGVALPLTGGGEVLGVSTSIPAINYDNMSWKDKFAELERLDQQIAALEKELNGQMPVDGRINDIDAEIAQLEAQMAEAQKKADVWYNQIIPTLPLQGDDDGVPWRVRADNFENEITDYEERINMLRSERDGLVAIKNKPEQLIQLRMQQSTLQANITDGIPADGPSPMYPYFKGEENTNCTKYASSKRNLPETVRGNAYQWNEQAVSGGYEVGSYPVKGSILVMEPGIKGANVPNGHVAFVERVEPQGNGTYKIIYTDNSHTDPAHPGQMIVTPGENGLSFIYDQKAAAT